MERAVCDLRIWIEGEDIADLWRKMKWIRETTLCVAGELEEGIDVRQITPRPPKRSREFKPTWWGQPMLSGQYGTAR